MLVNEQFRKCVTFLYRDVTERGAVKRVPVGSAFFVSVPILEERPRGENVVYAVTARHVVDGNVPLWLRMRLHDGDFIDMPVDPRTWAQHPSSDVAAALVSFDERFDWRMVGVDVFATREYVEQFEIGEGDEVFFSGLFVGHYGRGAPQPIIRVGNVALMPHEPVEVEISRNPRTFKDIEAYLVEARSWGGQSGSPTFVNFPANRRLGRALEAQGLPNFLLLGLVQGVWKDPRGALAPDPSGEGMVEVNMGISVVVPAYTVLEVLMSEEQESIREQLADEIRQGSAIPPEAASAEQSEFDRFEELTRNLVHTPKPEKDEKAE